MASIVLLHATEVHPIPGGCANGGTDLATTAGREVFDLSGPEDLRYGTETSPESTVAV